MNDEQAAQKNIFYEMEQLRKEIAHLKSLLAKHGIPWEEEPDPCTVSEPAPLYGAENGSKISAPSEKITLFRGLFHGRADVYAVRWESTKGKAGYAPACGNEWKPGICRKPSVKCAACDRRLLLPLTDQVLYNHLTGKCTVGVYPLLSDDTCRFLAIDFDGDDWREDARAFIQSGKELNVPAALEISRSGRGAHVWIFFSEPVSARQARQLGSALISHTCTRTRQLELSSYDRLFPNQDTLPKGGFGNLIALPLQKKARGRKCSVFVNESFEPFDDQWAFLASVSSMKTDELEKAIQRAIPDGHPLDVAFARISQAGAGQSNFY